MSMIQCVFWCWLIDPSSNDFCRCYMSQNSTYYWRSNKGDFWLIFRLSVRPTKFQYKDAWYMRRKCCIRLTWTIIFKEFGVLLYVDCINSNVVQNGDPYLRERFKFNFQCSACARLLTMGINAEFGRYSPMERPKRLWHTKRSHCWFETCWSSPETRGLLLS